MEFTIEEKIIALTAVSAGADFMFIPSHDLKNMIAKGHPMAKGINQVMTAILLMGKPIRLDSNMVVKYCMGTLDRNNKWLFDNGDIKVVPPQYKKPVKLKEDDKEIDNDKGEENGNEKND